jgi:hypothetical protein
VNPRWKRKTKTNNVELKSDCETEELFAISCESVNVIENTKQDIRKVTVKLEGVQSKMIVDTGSSVNLIDRKTFNRLREINKTLLLKSSKTKIYPYASKPIKVLGYFQGTFENDKHITVQKVFVVNNENAGNLLSLETAKELTYIDVNEKKIQINSKTLKVNTAATEHKSKQQQQFESSIEELVEECSDIFEGRGKLLNYECKLYIDKTITPVIQKNRRQP